MAGATGNIYVGLIEFTDMMFVLHFLREGRPFFDIGANVGTYTVLAAGVCGAKTWAFEPDKDAIRALNRNIAINNLQDLVRLHEIAVGDSDQHVAFTAGLGTAKTGLTKAAASMLGQCSRCASIPSLETLGLFSRNWT